MRYLPDVNTGKEIWKMVEFDSLNDFVSYITTTPINKSFEQNRKNDLSSEKPNKKNWSGTDSFQDAIDLMRNGWSLGAKKLEKSLKVSQSSMQVKTEAKQVLSMCGYQAVVPLYLNGVPNNMINKKLTPVKQKVVTINKVLSASCSVSSKTLEDESVKCFQIIKKIEESGIRVNLNLVISTGHVCTKIRLKSANERLNVSKLAFPLVHVSMFRRLYFKFIEVFPTIPLSYTWGYGRVPEEKEFKKALGKNEILLPTLLCGSHESEITKLSVDELIAKLSK